LTPEALHRRHDRVGNLDGIRIRLFDDRQTDRLAADDPAVRSPLREALNAGAVLDRLLDISHLAEGDGTVASGLSTGWRWRRRSGSLG